MYRIYLSPPDVSSGLEIDYLKSAVESGWVAPAGPFLQEFENVVAEVCQSPYAVAVNSGTSALHLALILAGVTKGDLVLCPSLTFVASANPILYCGAEPVFIDAETDSFNISVEALEYAITDLHRQGKKIKALMLVHIYGNPVEYDPISALCEKHHISIIEDAAEALGSVYKGRACGSLSNRAAISFNGNKLITTSGGGMLLLNNAEEAARARALSTQARMPGPWFNHTELAYNYRMSNLLAAVGVAQMTFLGERIAKRRAIQARYQELLSGLPVRFQKPTEGCELNYWLSNAVFEGDDETLLSKVINKGIEAGIEFRPLWSPLHQLSFYDGCRFYGSGNAEKLSKYGISLPSGQQMTDYEIQEVADLVKKCLQ